MDKSDKKLLVFALFFITIAFVVIIIGASYNASTWTKTYRLNNQFIASIPTSETGDSVPCDNCLIMEVQDEWWTPGGLMTQNHTLFFANEHNLRNDLQSGDIITVRWRWIDGERLIRGVWKE